VKVLDFGLAKLIERPPAEATMTALGTRPGLIMGTAAYMSPEQAEGHPVDARSDIFSFGAVLYEMLTGVRAFAGDDVTETMAAVVKSTPDWAALPADTPAPVVGLIQRCLETTGIWVMPADSRPATPKLFLESRFSLSHPEFSPDGRWMAYVSNESGGAEVYVRPYPGPGEKVRISTDSSDGGTEPVWAPNGRELLYRGFGENGGVFSATISSLSPFRVDPPRRVVELNSNEYDSTSPVRSWNVSPDGQRFLASRFERTGQPITTLQLVLNWGEELRRLVPAR
jgi:serine/threonine protein kinase